MSERGIEIHNGQVIFPEGMPQELHMGTWAAPITQGEAGQVIVSAVVNAVALGGDVTAGYFGVKASESLSGDRLRGIRSRVIVEEDVTLTGYIEGSYIQTEMEAGSSSTGWMIGLRIEQTMADDAEIAIVMGIFISNNIAIDPASKYTFIRMQENEASTVHSVFHIQKGVLCTDIEYLFEIGGTGSYVDFTSDGDHTINRGYFKVEAPGPSDRYILLYL